MDCSLPDSSVHGDSLGKNVEGDFSSRKFSQPRDQIQVPCIAGGLFTIWATRVAHKISCMQNYRKIGDKSILYFVSGDIKNEIALKT